MANPEVLNQIGQSLGTALTPISSTGYYIFLSVAAILCIGAVVLYTINKNSYRIRIAIMRPRGQTGAFDWETGYTGKHTYNKNKELRFKIYQAKKYKIQYNEEPIDQEFIIKSFSKNKMKEMVVFAPNNEGWLQPINMALKDLSRIEATVTNADLTYYQSELEAMDSLFGEKSFFERYYLFVLVILFIVCIGILWYMARQVHQASLTNLQAVKLLTDTAQQVAAQQSHNATAGPSTIPQVLNLG